MDDARKLFGWWDHFEERTLRTVEEAKVSEGEGNKLTALYYFPAQEELPHPSEVTPQDFDAQMERLNKRVIALERVERERDEAEMALRMLVYRSRKGLMTTDEQWAAIDRIATRNANPLRSEPLAGLHSK